MSQKELRTTIEKILSESHTGTMATVKNNKPHSRYMTFFHRDLKLYTPTDKDTDKTEELESNPYTHIIIGYDGKGFGDEYVEYQGKVSFNTSSDMKQELWNDDMKMYFDGPEDPNYILLEIEPVGIRLMNKKGEPPKELEM
ncbi:pyridoxamine 5'-phosphate oxidase family protein [Oceanobacillus halophilus]|uniref:General stress protein n=1 Tax=Oceanobacillus halophilus TaxID=930130 RepID=A0A495A2N1_9BACI|nr:pyridoxamine 5'-phosphate oxidase family protein [Oceanobacillus halophilus]RKQ33537.1 general stress protein [Oceanobacillus halophilus]